MYRLILITLILFISSHCWSKKLDSLKIETIKGQQYVLHLVEKGETLESLVKRYGSNLDLTIKVNDLKLKQVVKKQIIRIPLLVDTLNKVRSSAKSDTTNTVNEAHANAQAKDETKIRLHQVIIDESINAIAKKYKITSAQLIKWNNIKNGKIVVGQTLIVDESAAIKPYLRLNKPESQIPIIPSVKKLNNGSLREDTGMAIFGETGLIAHTTLPIGTIVNVINLENNRSCLVKISENISQEKYKNFDMILGADIQAKLQTNLPMIKVKLEFIQSQ